MGSPGRLSSRIAPLSAPMRSGFGDGSWHSQAVRWYSWKSTVSIRTMFPLGTGNPAYRLVRLEYPVQQVLISDQFSGSEVAAISTKFSEDVVPLTDLKVNPGRVIKHATDAHGPALLTSRGRGVAVVQSLNDHEAAEEERDFMRAVVMGLADLEAGREVPFAEAKVRLGLTERDVQGCDGPHE